MKLLLTLVLIVAALSAFAQKPQPFIYRERAFISFKSPYIYNGKPANNLGAVFGLRRSHIPEAKKYAKRGHSQIISIPFVNLTALGAAAIILKNKNSNNNRAGTYILGAAIAGTIYLFARTIHNGKKAVRAHNAALSPIN